MKLTTEQLKIVILATGRFHVCDLARELDLMGHQVRFYSGVPKSRTRQFGLPGRCSRSFWVWLLPAYLIMKLGRGREPWQGFGVRLLNFLLDVVVARLIEPCDVFIGVSGMCHSTAIAAHVKYGALVWIERGSQHILSQKRILDDIRQRCPTALTVTSAAVQSEMDDYALADVVAIPARHVEASFLAQGFPATKLFRNPYGVDFKMFPPTPAPSPTVPTILMVGQWSYRKGCDVLVEAWRQLEGIKLWHIGAVGDCPLPNDAGFMHVDVVSQDSLKSFYAQAHIFALASREEGLAMVQIQALSCGLPVVCSDRTGGEDLQAMLDDPSHVQVVSHDDPIALAEALATTLTKLPPAGQLRDLLGTSRERFSWCAYGQRCSEELRRRKALINHIV